MYPIRTLSGQEYLPPEGRCWANIREVYDRLVSDNRIWFGKSGDARPRSKTFLSEVDGATAWTWWPNEEVGHTQEAKKEIIAMMGKEDQFETPKPVRLIQRILQVSTQKDSIVLDSFAGSGTTGHAVLQQNTSDGGTRSFVLIEMEDYAETLTAERMRRAISGYGDGDSHVNALGGGFSYDELGPEIFLEDGSVNWAVGRSAVAAYLWHTETGTRLPTSAGGEDGRFLGEYLGVSYYLFAEEGKETVLDYSLLHSINNSNDPLVIYADACTLSAEFLLRHSITFKKIPRDIARF
jgi:adenine-specific DNA-methyltransferase